MADIVYRMTADEGKAVAGFMKILDAQRKVEGGARKMGRASKQGTDQMNKGLAKGTRSATRFVGALAGIGSLAGGVLLIARQLRAEYAHLIGQQRTAAETQIGVGEARAQALYNLPAGFGRQQLEGMIAQASKRYGVLQGAIWRGAGGPLSAMGSLTPAQFKDVLFQATRAHAAGGMDIGELAGGAMDIMRVTGAGATQGLGWMRQVGQQMRVTTLPEQIRSIVPIIGAAKQFGWTPESGAELGAYFTQFASDITGRKASTGAINFMANIQKATTKAGALIPEYAGMGPGGKPGVRFRTLKAAGMPGLREMQDWYGGASEELRREFIGKMPGEAKVKGAILALIAQDPKALKAYEQAKKEIAAPTAAGLGAIWEGWFGDVAKGRGEPVRAVSRVFGQFVEGQQLANAQALAGAMRGGLMKGLRAIPGVSDLAIKYAGAKFELGSDFGRGDVYGAGIERLEAVQRKFGYGARFREYSSIYDPRAEYRRRVPPGAETRMVGHTMGFGGEMGLMWPEGGKWQTYVYNPNYDPEQARAIQDLINELKALRAEVHQRNVGTVNPNAQIEAEGQ